MRVNKIGFTTHIRKCGPIVYFSFCSFSLPNFYSIFNTLIKFIILLHIILYMTISVHIRMLELVLQN